jgi:hypothetical protein
MDRPSFQPFSRFAGLGDLWLLLLAALTLLLFLSGCSPTITPGGPADFATLGISPNDYALRDDAKVDAVRRRQPEVTFPATLAVIRVQGRGYGTSSAQGLGEGRFTIVTTRDVEGEESFSRLRHLPQVKAVAPANRLVVPRYVHTESDLRAIAAAMQADVLLVYTFDTRTTSSVSVVGAGFWTAGLVPNEVQQCDSTASAALIDVKSGYVLGVCEAQGSDRRTNNAWHTRLAMDNARKAAEANAFDNLVPRVEATWAQVLNAR